MPNISREDSPAKVSTNPTVYAYGFMFLVGLGYSGWVPEATAYVSIPFFLSIFFYICSAGRHIDCDAEAAEENGQRFLRCAKFFTVLAFANTVLEFAVLRHGWA